MKNWILQSNPIKVNIYKELFESNVIKWSISRYRNEVSIGDKVFIWIAEGDTPGYGGIVGKGKVIVGPVIDPSRTTHSIVTVKIEELRFTEEEGALLRRKLKNIKDLENLSILRSPNNAIFKLSALENEVIEDIWNSKNYGSVIYDKKIININSTMNITRAVESYCINKLGYLNDKELDENISDVRKKSSLYINDDWFFQNNEATNYWQNANIYLVNEPLMDEIHHPCENLYINEDYLKDLILGIKETRDNKEEIIEGLWERIKEQRKCTPAMGVYISKLNESLSAKIARVYDVNIDNRNLIFICPERVFNWCDNNKDIFPTAFAMVVIHELAHYYTHFKKTKNQVTLNYYNEPWGKVIEESLANILAYNRFSVSEKATLRKLITKQPFEYKGCIYWILLSEIETIKAAVHWAQLNSQEIRESIKDISDVKFNHKSKWNNIFWKELAIEICNSIIKP